MKDADYYMEHADEFDQLSEEDQARVFAGQAPEGETESGESPDPAESEAQEVKPEEVKPEEPTVIAKDGKNTIPYSELEAAREKARQLEQVTNDQAALIASLQEAKAKDAETGGTDAQEQVLADYEGDYPELLADMKPWLEKLIESRAEIKVREMSAKLIELEQKFAPAQEQAARSAMEAHFRAIAAAHPDYEAVAGGEALTQWIDAQPSFVREQYKQVVEQGSSEQVIELLDAFRAENKPTGKPSVAELAAAKLAGLKDPVPTSLSDVPGATAAHHDEMEAMLEMSSDAVLNKFMGRSPEEIEAALSRLT